MTSNVVVALLLCLAISANSDNCVIDFMDTGHEVAESKYLIDLSVKNTQHGMASTYFPDTQYDIIIRPKSEALTFKEFHFKMENVNRSMSYGALELRDPDLSTFDTKDYCINRVINLATPNKPNITIGWQSPPTRSGCIELKAYVKETELRYHTANLTVCEDPRIELDDPGEILRNCCACEKAKYEMIFQGMWSKYTHPKNFPKKDWLAGFPTVVGAAHDPHYEIWSVYKNASDALKRFAETGYSVALELEMKAHQVNVTTFIKFRGTNFKNKTHARAQLRVDRKNHVVSLLARINPSPDWFIGVSSLELCRSDCTWMENKTLNLYAYDAGSRTGVAFEQENNGYTHDVINPMNMSWPVPDINNTIPPFYDKTNNTHEVRPLAQIHFRRIRVFGTTCAPIKNESIVNEDCVGEWTVTHECTVTCGLGLRVLKREYLEGYDETNCNADLEKREKCGDANIKCDDVINEETCVMTQWSDWRRCTQSCGQETIDRTRHYKVRKYDDKCRDKFPDNSLSEYKDCGHPPCPNEKTECDNNLYSSWSEWSACSVTVGRGLQYRHREKIKKIITKDGDHVDTGFVSCTYDKKVCDGVDPASITEAPVTEQEPGLEIFYNRPQIQQRSRPRECLQPVDEGTHCFGEKPDSLHRWAYNKDSNRCESFRYYGCSGNDNRFMDEIECNKKCFIGEKIECQLSPWSYWSGCTGCRSEETRRRTVLVTPSPLAKPCPVANRLESRQCPKKRGCEFIKKH